MNLKHFHIWSSGCHRVSNVQLCIQFHQNWMIFAARCYAYARPMPSCGVRPSVCPSVTFMDCARGIVLLKTTTDRHEASRDPDV